MRFFQENNKHSLLKVALIRTVLQHSSYPQKDEPNCFPELEILKLSYGNAVKIEYDLKFESFKGKKAALSSNWQPFKIQNSKFRKIIWFICLRI